MMAPHLRRTLYWGLLLAFGLGSATQAQQSDTAWQPAAGPLFTRWSKTIDPAHVHAEYPRPQLQRAQWQNLNGLWQYAITPRDEARPQDYSGKILVPFPIESALSGVGGKVGAEYELWYRRSFKLQRPAAAGARLWLHFGAVDWRTTVWVNEVEVGRHEGGYDPFSFDITEALRAGEEQVLEVRVWDPTDTSFQPRGKQVVDPRGIWYTSVTGIWQTVWLEWVPEQAIAGLRLQTRIAEPRIDVQLETVNSTPADQAWVEVLDGERVVGRAAGSAAETLTIDVPGAKLWSPDSPHLYTLRIGLKSADGRSEDQVTSYAGIREIALKPDDAGRLRLALNGEPLFQFGPLDQGWWPDGLYTAPSDEALRYDLEVTKKLGFNMVRKHVKVEPARWYYHCDRLGLLVWQDMPNGDRHIRPEDPDIVRSAESEEVFRQEWAAIMEALVNHPCIVVWVPFNEGWGQFKTNEILAWTKDRDPTRLVDGPSGWSDRGEGDMNDMHRYPGPGMPPVEEKRAVVLGEFGGLGLPVADHLWWDKRNWGYRTYTTREELQVNYEGLIRRLKPLIARGLAAAVYTQTTDVEGEVNGLLTYDRDLLKLDAGRIAELHAELYRPQTPVQLEQFVASSEHEPQTWKYTTAKPDKSWNQVAFDDREWKSGPGGFGEPTTPGSVVRTPWKTDDIWLRREFTASSGSGPLYLRIHHDEDAEIYLNGVLIATASGYVTEYTDVELGSDARGALREGKNVLAVHCHQTGGGQYIDVGLQWARAVRE